MASAAPDRPQRSRGLIFLVPLLAFAALGAVLGYGLTRDPGSLPSTLIGKPAPDFSLGPVPGRDEAGLSRTDLQDGPLLLNIFASWCVPCRVEAPVLERLAQQGVVIHGVDYKDKPADALAWLKELGDPFRKIGADRDGRVAIDWGVYGVPETFVIDRQGRIAYKFVGPLQPQDVDRAILPLLEKLK